MFPLGSVAEALKYNFYIELMSYRSLVIRVIYSGSESTKETIDFIDVYDTEGSDIKARVDGKAVTAHPSDQNSMSRIEANIDLSSKKKGKWLLSYHILINILVKWQQM